MSKLLTSASSSRSLDGLTYRRLSPGEDQQPTLLYGEAITNYQQESNMHPHLNGLPPAIAQSLQPFLSPPHVLCQTCNTSGDPAHHNPEHCAMLVEMKDKHDAIYLRASQVIKQASEAERAADDIEANRDKAVKAHAHQEHTGLLDQINDKTGAYQ